MLSCTAHNGCSNYVVQNPAGIITRVLPQDCSGCSCAHLLPVVAAGGGSSARRPAIGSVFLWEAVLVVSFDEVPVRASQQVSLQGFKVQACILLQSVHTLPSLSPGNKRTNEESHKNRLITLFPVLEPHGNPFYKTKYAINAMNFMAMKPQQLAYAITFSTPVFRISLNCLATCDTPHI